MTFFSDKRYRSPVTVWSSSRLVSQAFNLDSRDGIHMGQFALKIVRAFRLSTDLINSSLI